ncbi:uncharacterized protein LOC118928935 [Manis pentadactyla]|uniref:uncharacterized protein LOC118928935 n=1 Tax=Manis pentadactyla TaxID=143292 RepID=UPI00255C4F29|nr:uncharacterized protein LOC118928935 [Manis pentadactyla]
MAAAAAAAGSGAAGGWPHGGQGPGPAQRANTFPLGRRRGWRPELRSAGAAQRPERAGWRGRGRRTRFSLSWTTLHVDSTHSNKFWSSDFNRGSVSKTRKPFKKGIILTDLLHLHPFCDTPEGHIISWHLNKDPTGVNRVGSQAYLSETRALQVKILLSALFLPYTRSTSFRCNGFFTVFSQLLECSWICPAFTCLFWHFPVLVHDLNNRYRIKAHENASHLL